MIGSPLAASTLSAVGDVVTSTQGRILLSVALGGLVVATVILGRILRKRLVDRLGAALARSVSTLIVLIVVAAASAVVVEIWDQTGLLASAFNSTFEDVQLAKVILSLAIFVATHFVSTFVKQLYEDLLEDSNAVTEHQEEVTYRVTQLVLYVTAVLIVLGIWELNVGGLLVGAGFAGIVFGMAARQTLSNVLAGFVLMFSRPFEVGDWIAAGDNEGIVTDITIINTRIRTFDGEYIIVPNNLIRNRDITNRSRTGRLRIEVEVGVDYDDDPEQAREQCLDAVRGADRVLDVPAPSAVTKRFGDSAVVLGIRGWIQNPSAQRQWRARTEMIEAIKRGLDEEEITIPFPQRELSNRRPGDGSALSHGVGVEQSAPKSGGDGT